MYELKDEYLTGIPLVDEEHKKIFEIAEKAYQLQHDEFIPDKYDYVNEVLQELRDYSMQHFEDEEAYMDSINYKRMFTQKMHHQAFREKLNELYNRLETEESSDILVDEILEFLTDWFLNHIYHHDKLIGK